MNFNRVNGFSVIEYILKKYSIVKMVTEIISIIKNNLEKLFLKESTD
ncbi:hypothetical protein AAEX28_13900 [Lentisphaerota bacterium WC36G]|nr:hypothetical protein LJT99_00650 [Lentisphaerae bacterium WC36]